MTVRTKTELREELARLITSNGAGGVSAADLRSVLGDMIDSVPDVTDQGGLVPVQQPVSYAMWIRSDANLPSPADMLANATPGTNAVTLAAADPPITDPVYLIGMIPHDRWPLAHRPELSDVVGGIEVQLYDSSQDGAWALIQSDELAGRVADIVRTVTWWPA